MPSVELKKQAFRFLKSLKDKSLFKRISDQIDGLEQNPYPHGIERVEGYRDVKVFRVRVGGYRILYFVDHAAGKVYVEKIDKREKIYEGR